MYHNLAAVVTDLAVSQKSFFLIHEFNKCISNTDLSVGVFQKTPHAPPVHPFFGCKSWSFLSSFTGTVISTSLEEADFTLQSTNKTNKFLYLWNLDWITHTVNYDLAMKILRDDNLKIIARSQSHATAINNFCNKEPVGIVDDWNIEQLLEVTL